MDIAIFYFDGQYLETMCQIYTIVKNTTKKIRFLIVTPNWDNEEFKLKLAELSKDIGFEFEIFFLEYRKMEMEIDPNGSLTIKSYTNYAKMIFSTFKGLEIKRLFFISPYILVEGNIDNFLEEEPNSPVALVPDEEENLLFDIGIFSQDLEKEFVEYMKAIKPYENPTVWDSQKFLLDFLWTRAMSTKNYRHLFKNYFIDDDWYWEKESFKESLNKISKLLSVKKIENPSKLADDKIYFKQDGDEFYFYYDYRYFCIIPISYGEKSTDINVRKVSFVGIHPRNELVRLDKDGINICSYNFNIFKNELYLETIAIKVVLKQMSIKRANAIFKKYGYTGTLEDMSYAMIKDVMAEQKIEVDYPLEKRFKKKN